MTTEGKPGLSKQDLATLDVNTLTPLSPEVISRQATINIGALRSLGWEEMGGKCNGLTSTLRLAFCIRHDWPRGARQVHRCQGDIWRACKLACFPRIVPLLE